MAGHIRTEAELARAISDSGLGGSMEALMREQQPGLELIPRVVEGLMPTAGSKFGGLPALPDSAPWPTISDIPLSFVVQIDLSDLRTTFAGSALPSEGVLSFFHLTGSGDEGAVLFFDDPGSLSLRDAPTRRLPRSLFRREREIPPVSFDEHALQFDEVLTLPCSDRLIELCGGQADSVDLLLQAVGATSRMLGHGHAVQGRVEAEFAEVGGPGCWRSLLQIDSSTGPFEHRHWGRDGLLSYGIRSEQLLEAVFTDCAVVVQYP